MSTSTFTTTTLPKLTYEICNFLPVFERSYKLLRLVGEQFKPCARPYWSRNDTYMSSSPLVTFCKVHLPKKVRDQRLRRSWRMTRLWTTCARPLPFSPRSTLWSSNINLIRCPFLRWCSIFTTYPKSIRRSCLATLSRTRSSSTWLSWHNDASSSCTALLTVCRICSTHDTLEMGCLRIHKAAWRKCWSTVLSTMLRPLMTTARRSYTFNSWCISFLQQRRGRRTPSITRCCPREWRPCCSTGRPMDVSGQICKAARSVSLVWWRLMWRPNETSQRWASSIPIWGIPWAPRLLRSSCSSRATWVCFTTVRRTMIIPARVIPIMPALINVTWNKTMVLIQIGFYSFKP